jgi:hypothetical protein
MSGEVSRVGKKALAALGSEGMDPIVSAVTIWEVAIKRGLGKLEAPHDLPSQLEGAGVELLPISARHADLAGSLPPHHRDRSVEAHMEADGGAGLTRTDPHQVADLVGHPEAATAILDRRRAYPADQRLLDTAGVGDLDDQRPRFAPEPRSAVTAAMADAVGGKLAGGEDEIGGALAGEARGFGLRGDQPAEVMQALTAKGELAGTRRAGLETTGEGIGRAVQLAALAVGAATAIRGQVGVALRCRLQHLVLERGDVVWTEQRPSGAATEGDVEQGLVALALVNLDGAAAGPDRFADAAGPGAGGDVLIDELAPGGNDQGGVMPERLHVGEAHSLGVGAQFPLQQLDLPCANCDQRRFAGL